MSWQRGELAVSIYQRTKETMWVGSASVGPWRGNRPPTSYLHIQTGCRMHLVPQTDKWNLIISILELFTFVCFSCFLFKFSIYVVYMHSAIFERDANGLIRLKKVECSFK